MKKTLFVLGAGASKGFSNIFPTGLELIKAINYHFLTEKKHRDVDKDGDYVSAMMNQIQKDVCEDEDILNKLKNILWQVQLHYEHGYLRGKPEEMSIDNLITTEIRNSKYKNTDEFCIAAENIVKYSIYYLIKGLEEAYCDGCKNGVYSYQKTWIYSLARKFSQCNIHDISKNLTVITFNYDRIFEAFFPTALSHVFKSSVSFDNVKHVYGDLGDLSSVGLELKNNTTSVLASNYNRIQLMRSGIEYESIIVNHEQFEEVHFLGFAYDKINIERLEIDKFENAKFFGTALYLPEDRRRLIQDEYNIATYDTNCDEYIKQFAL